MARLARAAIAMALTTLLGGAGNVGAERVASVSPQLAGVNFVSHCAFSHRAPDDPIVAPGVPGASHNHTFVGARSTSAHSTVESLRASGTTCHRPGDTAAYWAPTLLDARGSAIVPLGATVYYRRETREPVQPFPAGFRMIAGDARASQPQPLRITSWNCGSAPMQRASTPPACPPGRNTSLRLRVSFPSCWDGISLDAADHKSHVVYPRRGACPSTHPVGLPAVTLVYRYPDVREHATLASGGVFSAHADFLNAWDAPSLAALVEGCLNAFRRCRAGT